MASLLPVATTVLAMLLSIQPVHIPGYEAVTPAFTLMAAYHWTIYRPDLLPALALFVIGTLQDLLTGGPGGWSGRLPPAGASASGLGNASPRP